MFFPATARVLGGSRLLPIAVCVGGLIGCHSTGGHATGEPAYVAPQHAAGPGYQAGPGAYDEHFVPDHRAVQPEPRPAPVQGNDGGVGVPAPVTRRGGGEAFENRVSRRAPAPRAGHSPARRTVAAPVAASREQARVIELDTPDQRPSASYPALSRIEEEQVSVGEPVPDSTAVPSGRGLSSGSRPALPGPVLPGPVLPGLNAPGWQAEERDVDEPQWQPVPENRGLAAPLDLTPDEVSARSRRASVVSGSDIAANAGVVESHGAVARSAGGLRIAKSRLCDEVRGLGAVSGIDTGVVSPGQSVLVYVELEGVATTTTPEGVRSETSARAKFLAWNGISLREQVLGRAVDVGDTQRDGYYLSHQFDIPADFPEGEYELELTVDDVAGGTSATTRVPLKVAK